MAKKWLLLLIFAAILSLALSSNVFVPEAQAALQTASPPQAEVLAAALNLREGPGVNYPVVAIAYAGDIFEIVGVNAAQTWLQVKRPDGSLAWMSGWSTYTNVQGTLEAVPVVQAPASGAAAATTGGQTDQAGKLVFMNASGGNIYVINADGTGLRLLVSGGIDPALSPDGQQVAFTRWGLNEGVYLINVDGTNERLVHAAHQPKSPTWSPDGAQLIFNMQRGGRLDVVRECKKSSADSSEDANLPPDAYDIDRSVIIEDEEFEYCYSLPPRPNWQLRKLDLAAGQFQDLNSDFGSFGPAWDPRNPWRVIFSGDTNLVQLDINQNTKTTFAEGRRDHTPAFSADGKYLALAHKQDNNQWVIQVVNLDSNERTQLTFEGNNISPTWSPTSSQIAFLSDRTGQWQIWLMNAGGSQQRPMFAPDTLTGINFQFGEVDERMLSWGP
jgi:TolB protein